MNKFKAMLVGGLLLALSTLSLAENAAPFGFELGVATLAQVKAGVKDAVDIGVNEYSRGPMLKATDGLGVDGVQEALFIFTPEKVLTGVVLTMDKDPVSAVKTLQKKYKMTSNRVDSFMNKGNADFEKGDSVIKLEAPHLSFQQTISYLSKSLLAAYKASVKTEAAVKQKKKEAAL